MGTFLMGCVDNAFNPGSMQCLLLLQATDCVPTPAPAVGCWQTTPHSFGNGFLFAGPRGLRKCSGAPAVGCGKQPCIPSGMVFFSQGQGACVSAVGHLPAAANCSKQVLSNCSNSGVSTIFFEEAWL